MSLRVVVLASGEGTNLQALLDATGATGEAGTSGPSRGPSLPGTRVVAVVSDRPGARALERAAEAGVPALPLPCPRGCDRRAYDATLADAVAAYEPDLVFLLGWMRLLSGAFLSRFPGRVANLHPALPGAFPGVRAIERALEAYRSGVIKGTGVMTHLVPDEGVDSGPVILTEDVPIEPHDELATLEGRVHAAERRLVVSTVARFASGDIPLS